MKRLSEVALIFIGFFVIVFSVAILGFGPDAYNQYLKTYNTQKDREMFLKSYEIVIECKKSYGVNTISATKVCGEVPTFYEEVK
jgi:hypothetical protein